jgi:pimeloyl-ACP methyl ester carboxylesterase
MNHRVLFRLLLFCSIACNLLSGRAQTSLLQITNLSQTERGFHLMWKQPSEDAHYTLQFRDTLGNDLWRVPQLFYPFPTLTNEWTDVAATNESRFFRLVQVTPAERGKLISINLATNFSVLQLRFMFAFAGITNITPQYAVRLYKVVYETITPLGGRTTASGALCVPVGTGNALPLLSYQHLTVTLTNKPPSSMDLGTEIVVGIAFATSGYAVAVPDYLGLGNSPGLHPYHHARSEATACVDMLRSVKTACATNGFPLTNRLFLCGYSEGGHATMALLRELEWFHTNEFTVTACAPMAGAYDLSGVTTADFLSARPKPNPYYFLYLLAAYQEVYELAPSLPDLLVTPYNTNLPPLLAGNSTGSEINALMPADPIQILKPEFLADFKINPRNPLRIALEDNDVYRWKPATPLRFYHCAGDQDVIKANSMVAVSYLQSIGVTNVSLNDPLPSGGHSDCVQPSLVQAKAWFDSLR